MTDPGEIAHFYDSCSDLMRQLLDGLAAAPNRPRPFPEIEDTIGWPRRRIASVLGGVCHLRKVRFGGRRPYRFHDPRQAASGRWEIWMDEHQSRAIRAEPAGRDGSYWITALSTRPSAPTHSDTSVLRGIEIFPADERHTHVCRDAPARSAAEAVAQRGDPV